MLLFWKLRYLDSRDRQFKDRQLWLDTDTLDPITKAAVEATYDLKDTGHGREMVRYRPLFQEKTHPSHEMQVLWHDQGGRGALFIHDYFEDETGQELTYQRMGVILTGDPQSAFFAPGTTQNDIDYSLAEKPPINFKQVTLSPDQLNVLGYFARDLHELLESAFIKDGPGTLNGPWSDGRCRLETAVPDEEIRSFMTIFRRLYMDNEPANFVKAVTVFSDTLQGHPLAKWAQGIAAEYRRALQAPPDCASVVANVKVSFSRKRLIDVFLYTQYAHQPDRRRTRQFRDCLASVGGDQDVLTWFFLTEVWKCALHMHNAGVVVAEFYNRYCQCHSITCEVLASVRNNHPGLGALEKKEAQEARILREKAEELAKALWQSAGRPEGGHTAYVKPALEQLTVAIGRTKGSRA